MKFPNMSLLMLSCREIDWNSVNINGRPKKALGVNPVFNSFGHHAIRLAALPVTQQA
jgi:hypothetical protein